MSDGTGMWHRRHHDDLASFGTELTNIFLLHTCPYKISIRFEIYILFLSSLSAPYRFRFDNALIQTSETKNKYKNHHIHRAPQ